MTFTPSSLPLFATTIECLRTAYPTLTVSTPSEDIIYRPSSKMLILQFHLICRKAMRGQRASTRVRHQHRPHHRMARAILSNTVDMKTCTQPPPGSIQALTSSAKAILSKRNLKERAAGKEQTLSQDHMPSSNKVGHPVSLPPRHLLTLSLQTRQ